MLPYQFNSAVERRDSGYGGIPFHGNGLQPTSKQILLTVWDTRSNWITLQNGEPNTSQHRITTPLLNVTDQYCMTHLPQKTNPYI
jgi:hypothetical protein